MKNSKFITFVALACAGLTACNSNKEQVATGIICDGSMNTLMIVSTNGDTLSFSTMDADKTQANGLLIGDTAQVFYTGKTGLLTATKVIVTPAQRGNTEILGEWIQPIESMPGETQGIKIDENGTASSINMATLVYEKWSQDGDQLILSGQSIGNGQTIQFTDTLKIETVTPDSLILSSNGNIIRYSRKN